jgi:hypothetical protein
MKVFLFLLCLPLTSWAGTQSGKVDYLIVRASDGLVYFTLKGGSLNNSPSCATNSYWMIKDENSVAGQQQYSMLLAAHAAQKTVNVSGMNTCSRWGDGEDVNSVQIIQK